MRPLTESAFWSKADRSGGPDTCWPWMASRLASGYGRVVIAERNVRAHRMAYAYVNGPIPEGLVVRHSCDNRACVNPAHLLIGTIGDNNRDTASRGRHWSQRPIRTARVCRGAAHPRAVLTEDIVRQARALAASGLGPSAVSRRLGVSLLAITDMLNGRTWRHVA